MKFKSVLVDAKVLNVEKKSNQDNSISWTEVVTLQGSNCNTFIVDSKLADTLKIGSTYNLVVSVYEVAKAYKNGSGAYVENKFKIVDKV